MKFERNQVTCDLHPQGKYVHYSGHFSGIYRARDIQDIFLDLRIMHQ